jgi:hypothetical protein
LGILYRTEGPIVLVVVYFPDFILQRFISYLNTGEYSSPDILDIILPYRILLSNIETGSIGNPIDIILNKVGFGSLKSP